MAAAEQNRERLELVMAAAKDLATNKEQSIQITASSGLSEEEINAAVKDAELHAEEDKKRREVIDLKNQADQLIYATEKTLSENADKVGAEDKSAIESAVADLKQALERDDADAIDHDRLGSERRDR